MKSRIILDKFQASDFHHYFKMVKNEQIMEMITGRPLFLEEAQARYAKLLVNNDIHPAFGSFKILDAHTKECIGFAKLELQARNSEEAELGYMLHPKYWGKGLANEASQQLIEVAKKQKTIKKLIGIIDPDNAASRKILTNNGFIHKEFTESDGIKAEVLELIL